MLGIILLIVGIIMSGVYAVGLKPANSRCRSLAELQLFNGCFTFIAMLGAGATALVRGGSLYIPFTGVLAAVAFGCVFSICVFSNLKALEVGPLSLTTLIVNFSLVMPLIYSFCFLGEELSMLRIIGIVLLVICMLLFTNPKVTGEKKISGLWLVLSLTALFCNGFLSVTAKIYAMATDNAYSGPYLACCYLCATITSLILFAVLRSKQPREERRTMKDFFTPGMFGCILLVGFANFGLNLVVVLLATLMDGAIVYPAIQGGGPMIAALCSRLFFGEQISWKKGAAILLGVLAIVLLNL
ncbi:MAG: EamA family transporter [Clostridia bacterium]|nr:EamA family transporter [Clostridia bacterium]